MVLKKVTGVKYEMKNTVMKPLLCSVLSGVGAWGSHMIFVRLIENIGIASGVTANKLSTIGAVGMAVVIYLIALFATKTLQKSDVVMLPKGEKIAKVLEKYRLIG